MPVVNDTDEEEDETFTVTLSAPQNATILRSTATGTITDDDGVGPPSLPTLSIGDAAADGGRGECGLHGDAERGERRCRDGGV